MDTAIKSNELKVKDVESLLKIGELYVAFKKCLSKVLIE
jgi:hypothetical protein